VQASRTWEPPGGTLGLILEDTRRRLTSIERTTTAPTPAKPAGRSGRSSLLASLRGGEVGIIAEIKRRSPSKGVLSASLDAAAQAATFERGGAAAISVLTEPSFFGGNIDDLLSARAAVRVPVLKKDFHVDLSQLIEARDAEATAVLLIARALSPDELPKLMAAARQLELETVVEVRTESELERALEAGAEIVGVNSRDLETLEIDEGVPERLMPTIPPHIVRIWESGVQDRRGVERAAECGADAVLVGSALSRAPDPAVLLRSLRGVPRRRRND
jgi:indole-3-glycerol phosphate synthase